ncbi:MAG TPA: phosphoglycerate dehydrogenase family protein [Lachnospiraceae bacterium]|nr:phosphoglycerate dehydrogenase family protein [Lachnospiraceae bacterium]
MLIWIIDNEWPDYEIEKKAIYEKFPNCEIKFSAEDYKDDLEKFGYNADAIICQISVDILKETIDKLEKCKVISVYGVGYDRVDIKAAKEKGIYVTNVPGYCAEDVSDYVIAALYRHNKQLSSYNSDIKNGLWGAQAVKRKIKRLSSQSLFIVGFGRIGRLIANKAVAFGMTVMYYDPFVSQETAKEMGVTKVEFEEGFKTADYISLNSKLDNTTKHLISEKELNLMKPEAHIINASRGKVIDEKALIKAVESGKIEGATLDVIENEPPTGNEDVFKCEKIFVTPHISYFSVDSLNELQLTAALNAINILDGKIISEIVNK